MKLTKRQLKRIIREELINESSGAIPVGAESLMKAAVRDTSSDGSDYADLHIAMIDLAAGLDSGFYQYKSLVKDLDPGSKFDPRFLTFHMRKYHQANNNQGAMPWPTSEEFQAEVTQRRDDMLAAAAAARAASLAREPKPPLYGPGGTHPRAHS